MLVWGHWRLGKNRLCVYPSLSSFSQCWFQSSSGNTLRMFKKTFSPFWKWPNASWREAHTRCILNCAYQRGHNRLHTATLGSEYRTRPAAFPELSRNLLLLKSSFCLLPLALTLTLWLFFPFSQLFLFRPASFGLCLLASFIPLSLSLSVPFCSLCIDSA